MTSTNPADFEPLLKRQSHAQLVSVLLELETDHEVVLQRLQRLVDARRQLRRTRRVAEPSRSSYLAPLKISLVLRTMLHWFVKCVQMCNWTKSFLRLTITK